MTKMTVEVAPGSIMPNAPHLDIKDDSSTSVAAHFLTSDHHQPSSISPTKKILKSSKKGKICNGAHIV